jgi:hypothetical protein
MKQFKKRPVVVEAARWDGTAAGATPIIDWVLSNGGTARFDDYSNVYMTYLKIDTMEGTMIARTGWWIIKGVKGEFYPCEPDIFEQTYEALVPEGEPA